MNGRISEFLTVTVLSIVLLLSQTSLFAEAGESWEYGGIVYRLPVPREKVVIPTGTPESHTVVKGDCLWNIAKQYLADPLLWPMIWDLNKDTIKNPHLIFPSQVVILPGMKGTSETEVAEETAGGIEEKKTTVNVPMPRQYVVCSGSITDSKVKGPKITAAEIEIYDLSAGDVCYIDTGSDAGVKAGDKFYAVRTERPIKHPISGSKVGYLTRILSELEVICVQPKSSTAVIRVSYMPVHIGDVVEPWYEIPDPAAIDLPDLEKCEFPSGKAAGYVIDSYYGAQGVAEAVNISYGDVIYLDVGSKNGVVAGDHFAVYSVFKDKTLPKVYVGEVIVLRANEKFCSAVVTKFKSVINIGDVVEMR